MYKRNQNSGKITHVFQKIPFALNKNICQIGPMKKHACLKDTLLNKKTVVKEKQSCLYWTQKNIFTANCQSPRILQA